MTIYSLLTIYNTCLHTLVLVDYKSPSIMHNCPFTIYKGVKYLFTLEK